MAVQYPQDRVVSANPVDWTPHVLDGQVNAVVQIGNRVFVGGSFTQVREFDSATVQTRNRLFAFNATTGRLDTAFVPNMNNEVRTLLPAPGGQSIYAGGSFSTVNGATNRILTRLNTTTGQALPGFVPNFSARVLDLRLAGGRLYVGGAFATVNGQQQAALATIDPDTGAFDPYVGLQFAGTQNGGTTQILKMDVTPDETRLVAVGNFATVGGQNRRQLVQFDLTGPSATLANWDTTRYTATCSSSFNTYMRDVDYSPDGRFFVVTTTGAYSGGPPRLCDTHARWETYATGANLNPTWINYTGGDTSYAVAVTPQAVYVGGHFRWANNPFRGDAAGQGAVPRSGIAALDPVSGIPLSWNPGRTLGVGVFDLTATPTGMWLGSDTDRVNGEFHARLAMFPLAGGTIVRPPSAGALPGDVYQAGAGGTDAVQRRSYDGATAGPVQPVGDGGVAWSGARGTVMLSGQLYTAWSDGKLYKRTFNGTAFGAPSEVNLYGLTDFATDMQNMTGMFYDAGRLYFTRTGQSSLYYRGFSPESDIVGAQRTTATGNITGLNFSRVGGMFVNGDKLYLSDSVDGRLLRADFAGGLPVAGTVVAVSGPAIDGVDWRQRGLFLYAAAGTTAPNRPPVAALTTSCADLSCTVRNTGSADPDGTIVATTWNFGDGTTAAGALAAHTFPGSGTYPISVTVTDDRGGTATATATVTVQGANQAPTADFAVMCTELACTFDGSPSSDPDGSITGYAWDFGDASGGAGQSASHTYGAPGTYPVKLTVTDNSGAAHTVTKNISVVQNTGEIQFVGLARTSGNQQTHSLTVPAAVAGGDGLLLFLTVNTTVTMPDPAGVTGWTVVGTQDNGGVLTKVWKKVAAPEDGGDPLSVTLSGLAKGDLALVAYRGTGNQVVAAHESANETVTRAEHTTPAVAVTTPGSWVVSYWGEKSSASTTLTPPAGETVRSAQTGTGNGRITSLLTDSGAQVATGTRSGLTATADSASLRATMWSLVIAP